MDEVIFQASDLAGKRRTEFVQAARDGSARLRDKDGTSLVMLPEGRVVSLQRVATWSANLLRLQELVHRGTRPSVTELGSLAWLRVFDIDDLKEFADELHQVLLAAISDEHVSALDEAIHAWRVTAREIEDPLRRSALTSEHDPAEFVLAAPPNGE